jgi:Fur family ferric uptake transcriptional regulator
MGHILLDRLHLYLMGCRRSKSAQRDLVYLAIHKLAPCTKAEIRLELANSDIHTASIYRSIQFLLDVKAIKVSGDKYEVSSHLASSHGHSLICEKCGRRVIFNRASIENAICNIAAGSGYTLLDHQLELVGICPNCQ